MMIILQKKRIIHHLLLCKAIKINISCRFMETTNIDYGNAFFLGLQNPAQMSPLMEEYAEKAIYYVAESITQQLPFSQIIIESKYAFEEEYQIHPESFVTILEALKNKNIVDIPFAINNLDDLNIYDKTTGKLINNWFPVYNHNLKNIIDYRNEEMNRPYSETTGDSTQSYQSDTESESTYEYTPSESEEEKEDVNYDTTSSEDSYISITNNTENKPTIFNDNDALFNNGDNNKIILLTISAFIIINLIAYGVRKYYPETLEKDSLDSAENFMSSVYEQCFILHKGYIQLLLVFMPTVLLFFYTYRYYYYYKLSYYKKR